MYSYLLFVHSWFRWLVFLSLCFALWRSYRGWLGKKTFTSLDNSVRHWTATIAQIQMLLGLWLYSLSPIVRYFLHNFRVAVHQRQARFFGMEHITSMLIAVLLLTIGSVLTKRKRSDVEKFRTMALWYTAAMLIIFFSIPWSFSPFDSRPLFRTF